MLYAITSEYKSSSASKLNEFYKMQRMLIVLWSSLPPLTAQDMRHPLPKIPALLTFDSPADLQSLIKSTPPRNWLTKAGFKILSRAPPRVQSVTHNPVLIPHIRTLLTFARIDFDLLEWSVSISHIALNSKV